MSKQSNNKSIDYFFSTHPLRRYASNISYHARRNMFDTFMRCMQPTEQSRILDIGVTPDQCLPESNFFEQCYPYPDQIVASSIENAANIEQSYPGVQFVQTGKQGLPFKDKAFDIVFCAAVLEHVGTREEQRAFITEIIRVSRGFFLTTPNRYYPIEFHTFLPLLHWLPQPWHQLLLRYAGLDFWAKTENLNLLSKKDIHSLFPASIPYTIATHKLWGLPSNLLVYGHSNVR